MPPKMKSASRSGLSRRDRNVHHDPSERFVKLREPTDAAEAMAITTMREVRRLLQIDDEWLQENETGFDWWPDWFRQRVRFEPSRPSRGMQVSRVIVETPIAIAPPTLLPDALVDLMVNSPGTGDPSAHTGSWHPGAIVPGLSAVVQHDQLLYLRSSIIVHAETEDWIRKVIGFAAVDQLDTAFRAAPTLKNGLRLPLAVSAHPTSGTRTTPDAMVTALIASRPDSGMTSQQWTNAAEFTETARQLTASGFVSTTDGGEAPARGLTYEVPSGPNPGFAIEGKTSSLVQVETNVVHPRLGTGLFIRLRPYAPRIAKSAASRLSALEANAAECGDVLEASLLGSWTGTRGDGLSFISFLPDSLYQPGGMAILCWANVGRAQWFDAAFGASKPARWWKR